ncbi:Sulfite reductase [NADPH] hemoprotein beta-component [Buchnera aphidicola (Eriosoma grossulariae)]|uniref:assimilatory sulfite reductase (NADPH) hemoprotein subunit n=1 Tax=Buchnera aphidicola TaxID=9 RepID=UPI003464D493
MSKNIKNKQDNNIEQLSDFERIKVESNYLRGSITDDLKDNLTNGFTGDNYSLIRFHGMYQQDDRDIRAERIQQKLEPKHAMMLRCRLPGGIITPLQWLKIDEFSNLHTIYGSIRLTNRQTFQLHGIFKSKLKMIHKILHEIGLDSLGTAHDVNRNVLCTSNPIESTLHDEVYRWAKKISNHLLPKTKAYLEIWLDKSKVITTDHEPILSKRYLPRKFKTGILIPPDNDIDLHANDMNLIAIVEDNQLVGFNILVGGGLSIEHGNKNTWPSLSIEFGFVLLRNILIVVESIVTTQRDWGNRCNRKNAKTRYTLQKYGIKNFKNEVEKRSNIKFESIRPYKFLTRGDHFGWKKGIDNKWHLTLFIPGGRLLDDKNQLLKSGMNAIAKIHRGDFRLTANQNLIIARVDENDKKDIEDIALNYGLIKSVTNLQKSSMACVAFPTCPLAMSESERVLLIFIKKIERIMNQYGVGAKSIVFRISGCPNGCGRSLLAEIGLIGKSLGRYNLYLGGNSIGTRIASLYSENINESEIFNILDKLIKLWSEKRYPKERFGDFCIRYNISKKIINSMLDFWS